MSHDEDIDARLARLTAATEGVRPRADFSQRVMARIGQEQPGALIALGTPASAKIAASWPAPEGSSIGSTPRPSTARFRAVRGASPIATAS